MCCRLMCCIRCRSAACPPLQGPQMHALHGRQVSVVPYCANHATVRHGCQNSLSSAALPIAGKQSPLIWVAEQMGWSLCKASWTSTHLPSAQCNVHEQSLLSGSPGQSLAEAAPAIVAPPCAHTSQESSADYHPAVAAAGKSFWQCSQSFRSTPGHDLRCLGAEFCCCHEAVYPVMMTDEPGGQRDAAQEVLHCHWHCSASAACPH